MNGILTNTSTQCNVCNTEPKFRCSSCQVAYYCSKSHQIQDWKSHRQICSFHTKLKEYNSSKQKSVSKVDGKLSPARTASTPGSSQPAIDLPKCIEYNTIDRSSCSTIHELTERVLDKLTKCNFSVIDNFIQDPLLSDVEREIRCLYQNTDSFRPGQLSQTNRSQNVGIKSEKDIRGDFVAWVDFSAYPDARSLFSAVRCIDELIAVMGTNELLADCNIRSRSSVMVACYPGHGTHYKRHVDNPSRDGRKLTTILYLNRNYVPSTDGGLLRIYKPDSSAFYDIAPIFGRLVIFWSDSRTPHEVLPSFRERFAVSVWYFDTKERTEAIQSSDIDVPFNL